MVIITADKAIIKLIIMKKACCILLILFLIKSFTPFIAAQQPSRNKAYYEFMRNAKTSDLLYINDSVVYLMNKSPLRVFSGYLDLYDSYKEVTPVEIRIEVFGAQIPPKKNKKYQVIWNIKDNILYITDIRFYSISLADYDLVFPDNEQYRALEKLTKVNFDKTIPPLSNYPSLQINKIGMMPATWLNDTILVKRARKSFEDIDKWFETPCEKLIFKNGKLISRETTDIY